jgi:hypothetical protein
MKQKIALKRKNGKCNGVGSADENIYEKNRCRAFI